MNLKLEPGRLLRRYKRFLADVELADGRVVQAHCPNTGSMKTLLDLPRRAWVEHRPSPQRKLHWTLVLLETARGGWALVDTSRPNAVVQEGVLRGVVPQLVPASPIVRERGPEGVKKRFDLFFADESGRRVWVEIKNVTMDSSLRKGRSDFPDSVTQRGREHLELLTQLARAGDRAVQFFLLSRTDCDAVGLARDIDPAYAAALEDAQAGGVEVLAHRLVIDPRRLLLGEAVPIEH